MHFLRAKLRRYSTHRADAMHFPHSPISLFPVTPSCRGQYPDLKLPSPSSITSLLSIARALHHLITHPQTTFIPSYCFALEHLAPPKPLKFLAHHFRRNEQPSVSRALPPVGWQSWVEQPWQMTTVWAWLKTVVMVKQPGHLTSMKKERGEGTRVCAWPDVSQSEGD